METRADAGQDARRRLERRRPPRIEADGGAAEGLAEGARRDGAAGRAHPNLRLSGHAGG